MTPFRVAYLVSHPIQYQVPLLQRLAADPEIALHVYYLDDQGVQRRLDPEFGVPVRWDLPLLEGYSWQFLRNRSPWPEGDHFLRYIHPGIIAMLRKDRYDALIVHGYAHATEWLAFIGAWLSRTPLLLRGESTLLGDRPRWVTVGKRLVLRALLRRIRGALAIGVLNRQFYRAYGVPEERIFFTPYAVDNDRFLAEADRLSPSRLALREQLGWPAGRPVILCVGKLIPRKRPMDLLEAFARVEAQHPAVLVYVGDGSERRRLAEEAARRGLRHMVITGFVNQTEISRYYAAADLLVLPSSHEPWGLVLNEAMCFALPVVASDAVGAAPDLVRPGENGFVFPAGDVEALAHALRELLADPAGRARMGARSREIVARYSYDADLRGVLDAIRAVGARRPGLRDTAGTDPVPSQQADRRDERSAT